MLTGPMPATRKALAKAGLTIDDIDLFEVNEAFAAVPMRFMREMGVPHEKVNVNGGAIALGHPLGATGAMLRRHAARRARAPQPEARPGHAVRRRRHGHRDHRRARLRCRRHEHDPLRARCRRHRHDHLRRARLAGQHDDRRVAGRPRRGRRRSSVADKERIKGVLLASAKTTFFAGAALKSRDDADAKRRGAPASPGSRR